jgi:hypothetical protein
MSDYEQFLEHVIGSQSLVAAVGHAITLHSLNFLTLGLLVIWTLSPLGGQSALRLVHETNSTVFDNRSVFYADPDAASQLPIGSNNIDAMNRVNGVVSTALMTADTLEWSPVDTWNHPKIPRVEELEQAEDRNETSRTWYAVDRHANHSYASLTGVDVINLSRIGATNFTIPYEYMYFGCELSPHNNLTTTVTEDYTSVQTNYLTQLNYLRGLDGDDKLDSDGQFQYTNTTFSIAPVAPAVGLSPAIASNRGFFMYTRGTAIKPDALLYGSSSVSDTEYWLFECSMKSVMVEARIICEAESCGVEGLRRLDSSSMGRPSSDYLPYDIVHDGHANKYFIRYLAKIGGENGITTRNPVDAYIYGNAPWGTLLGSTLGLSKNWTEYVDQPQKAVDMSHRLTRVLNTYWDSSRWPTAMARNDPFGTVSLNQTSREPFPEMTMNKTDATVARQVPIYRANAGWVACLVICSSVLLLLGIFSLFLSLRITAPDIFDYVSSFTRDNQYVNAPQGGSGLDGAERARLLRKLRVQLGDADAGAETGYITMRSVEGKKDRELGRVRRDRTYR